MTGYFLQIKDGSTRDYKARYKYVKAKLALLTQKITSSSSKQKNDNGLVAESYDWDDESLSFVDEGITMVKTFMAIAEDESSVKKSDDTSGQWVEININNVQRLISMNGGDER
uniref:Retrovirus-related Pol polyprotein from transposon TNT 1-94 n=1 Tax=Tanacetum cinerariifolium TaxID=118510 RepID=A0A699IN84_TANCI|nr:hypothetical protein [Tanacetum cinerariifolium]